MNGIIMRPSPLMYAEVPIPIPLSCVGQSSPAKGQIIKNDADMADFENKNSTNVSVTASETVST